MIRRAFREGFAAFRRAPVLYLVAACAPAFALLATEGLPDPIGLTLMSRLVLALWLLANGIRVALALDAGAAVAPTALFSTAPGGLRQALNLLIILTIGFVGLATIVGVVFLPWLLFAAIRVVDAREDLGAAVSWAVGGIRYGAASRFAMIVALAGVVVGPPYGWLVLAPVLMPAWIRLYRLAATAGADGPGPVRAVGRR